MPVLDEIEAYFASQPEWQQQGYAALRFGKSVDAVVTAELTALCIKSASAQGNKATKSAAVAAPATPQDNTSDVRLLGIEKVQHINRLAADQSLKFASVGLTIVYGDNGAGKTGYGRIVRQVCQARGEAPRLRDSVFEEKQHAGSAEVIFSVNGVEDKATVSTGQSQVSPLRHFSIFDSAAASSLVNEQNATAFRPFGLDLLDRFTALADAVKPLQQQGDDALLQELAADNSEAASQSEALLVRGREVLSLIQIYHATGEPTLEHAAIQTVPAPLLQLAPALRQRAVELQNAGTATALSALQAEFAELEAAAKLAASAEQVKKEAARLARREILEKAKKFNTRGVSELSKRLTTQYVSEALCERFRTEVSRLGLTHLDVRLSPSDTQKGKLFHRLTLKAKQDAPLREVVSEGELRCLALAAFLAESGGNTSGLLFDDPVSSLDHTWRERIARRLAEEASARQVVVFTHDIVFHFALREAAESASINVPLAERCVERRGNAGAGFCRDDAPWAGMKTGKRIGVLKSDLVGLKKQHDVGDAHYERDMRDWYGRLRESWERAIEECLLNDAVRRFRHSVETSRLEKALQKVQPGDWAAIEKGMTRASAAIRGHDGAPEKNSPIPTPDEAKRDLDEFGAWVKTKN